MRINAVDSIMATSSLSNHFNDKSKFEQNAKFNKNEDFEQNAKFSTYLDNAKANLNSKKECVQIELEETSPVNLDYIVNQNIIIKSI